MKEPSIASVKEKIQEYRKNRKSIRQAIPSEIIADIHHLLKSHKKAQLKNELQITDAIINRAPKQTSATPFIRIAPVVLSESVPLSVEVSLPNGQAARLLGIPSAASAAEVLLQLMDGPRCSR